MIERQKEGIAKAKAEGKYKGRAPDAQDRVLQAHTMQKQGIKPAEIAKSLSLGRSTVYRILQQTNTLNACEDIRNFAAL